MKSFTFVCVLAVCGVIPVSSAKEFPLEFKAIKAEEVLSFPGGYGAYGELKTSKPPALKREPQATSTYPLYGQLRQSGTDGGFLFRLDETQGQGKGYDQLILDLNKNGDLTDDPVIGYAPTANARQVYGSSSERGLYGPIEGGEETRILGRRLVYFAQSYVSNRKRIASGTGQSSYLGSLRLKAGWYLETTVEMDDVRQKVGLVDGDADLHLGDPWQPIPYGPKEDQGWYFQTRDSFVLDRDGSQHFESKLFGTEQVSFGPVLYFGTAAYKVAVASDYTSLQVEAWPDPLVTLAIEPHGKQVHSVVLAWERSDDQWVLIEPESAGGKVRVPPGNYRFYASLLAATGQDEEPLMTAGYYRKRDRTFRVEAGQPVTVQCGAPLQVNVTAEKQKVAGGGLFGVLGGLFSGGKSKTDLNLQISASVTGAGGESYSSFAKGKGLRRDPPKPSFKILSEEGKSIASGNLEFG